MKQRRWNNEKIHDVANRIDNAERLVLQRLALNRETASVNQALEKSKQTWDFFDRQSDGSLMLKASTNQPKIHDVLWWLFTQKDKVFRIDYAGCTNPKIKQMMISQIWTTTCMIDYDEASSTYLLKDPQWNVIPNTRALIWEWVKLTPMGVINYNAKEQERAEKNAKTSRLTWDYMKGMTLDAVKNHPQWSKIIAGIPNDLKGELMDASAVDANVLKDFLWKTEKRIADILVGAKKKWWELQTESVSKIYARSWLMELHFISDGAEKSVKLWETKESLWNNTLYDILDSNEDGYKKYLQGRISSKRGQLDHETKQENMFTAIEGKDIKKLTSQEIEAVGWSLVLLSQLVEKIIQKEWSTWGSTDFNLQKVKRLISNGLYSLQEGGKQWISPDQLNSDLKAPLIKAWKELVWYTWTPQWKAWTVPEDTITPKFDAIFSGDRNKAVSAIRWLWQDQTFFGNQLTSYLADDIVQNKSIETKDKSYNVFFKNIDAALTIPENATEDQIKKMNTLIESFVNTEDALSCINLMVKSWLIPSDWEKVDKEAYLKAITSLKKKLQSVKERKNSATLESLAARQLQEKRALEKKANPSKEELTRLQWLQYLIDNPEAQRTINEEALRNVELFKYASVGGLVKAELGKLYIEQWGGAVWENADVINDILGVGAFNLSDENAEFAWELTQMVAEFIVVSMLTWWAGGALYIWALRAGASGARLLRMAKVADKISKIMTRSNRISRLSYHAGSVLLEAPIFNTVSHGLHAVIERNNFDISWQNLNPLAIENLKTASFLWALRWVTALRQGMATIDMGKAIKSLWNSFPGKTAAELSAMVVAEQPINLIRWREVQDPITWEIRVERWLHMPSQRELAQMIAFIIGGRATSSIQIWPKVEAKIASWEWMVVKTTSKDMILANNKWVKVTLSEALKNPEMLNVNENFSAEKVFEQFGGWKTKPEFDAMVLKSLEGTAWGLKTTAYLVKEWMTEQMIKDYAKTLQVAPNIPIETTKIEQNAPSEKWKSEAAPAKQQIENQFNNFKKTPEQLELANQNKWVEKQWRYELEVLQAKELLSAIQKSNPEVITPAMKKIMDAWDIIQLSRGDIKRLQNEIGIQNPDGVLWPVTLNRLSSHLDTQLSWVKNHVNPVEKSTRTQAEVDAAFLKSAIEVRPTQNSKNKNAVSRMRKAGSNQPKRQDSDLGAKPIKQNIGSAESKQPSPESTTPKVNQAEAPKSSNMFDKSAQDIANAMFTREPSKFELRAKKAMSDFFTGTSNLVNKARDALWALRMNALVTKTSKQAEEVATTSSIIIDWINNQKSSLGTKFTEIYNAAVNLKNNMVVYLKAKIGEVPVIDYVTWKDVATWNQRKAQLETTLQKTTAPWEITYIKDRIADCDRGVVLETIKTKNSIDEVVAYLKDPSINVVFGTSWERYTPAELANRVLDVAAGKVSVQYLPVSIRQVVQSFSVSEKGAKIVDENREGTNKPKVKQEELLGAGRGAWVFPQ
jgi:hypothetical protein